MSAFLGIAREPEFSPGKVDADRAILDAVADVLRARGHRVALTHPEGLPPRPPRGTTVFTMAQGEDALARLRDWERDGVRVVNSVAGVLNCHRHRMCDALARAGVGMPETMLFATAAPPPWPAWLARAGGWLKRGDVHATAEGDVRFVADVAAAMASAAELRARGIARAVLQRHVAGVVLKFYAVTGAFFAWFPPPATALTLAPPQNAALREVAERAAHALDLEIFGGDVVAGREGFEFVDFNDWPSYARCRPGAAQAIASRLEAHGEAGDR
ncbi:MAG TPA: hypothetical protein VKU61_06520 [Candidatus Binatia bacterium]|nr:hypothetical protein [Candidatus Binatia bacterium]